MSPGMNTFAMCSVIFPAAFPSDSPGDASQHTKRKPSDKRQRGQRGVKDFICSLAAGGSLHVQTDLILLLFGNT